MRVLGLVLALAFAAFAQGDDEDDDTVIEVAKPGDVVPEDEPEPEKPPPKPEPETKRTVKGGRTVHESGAYRIELPDDWDPESAGGDRALSFDLLLGDGRTRASLGVERREDLMDPRGAPLYYRNEKWESEILHDPLPMLVEQRDDRTVCRAFRKIRGNGFLVVFNCARDDFEAAREDFGKAALSFEADVERFPPIPGNYETAAKGRFLYAVHPSVKGSIRHIQRIVSAQEKIFGKVHGKLPRFDADERPVVFVHKDRFEAEPVRKEAAEHDFYIDHTHNRLFTIAVDENDRNKMGSLAGAANVFFLQLRYGHPGPDWVRQGEWSLGHAEYVTGKPLPLLHEGIVAWMNGLQVTTLDAIEGIRESNQESYQRQALFYMCLFRAGPSKYRKAYKGFLKEFRDTHQWEPTLERHIHSLGFDEMRQAVQDFMYRRIKPHHPKH